MTAPPTIADVQFEAVLERVCETYTVTREEVLGRSRMARHAWPRQVLCYALRHAGWEAVRIAERVERDHATVSHAVTAVARRMRVSREAEGSVGYICGALGLVLLGEDSRALAEIEATAERVCASLRDVLTALEVLDRRAADIRRRIGAHTRGAA